LAIAITLGWPENTNVVTGPELAALDRAAARNAADLVLTDADLTVLGTLPASRLLSAFHPPAAPRQPAY
jgi:hypothetical protein